jgi:hypothetical protein
MHCGAFDCSDQDRVVLFAKVRDEPIDQSQAYFRLAVDDGKDVLDAIAL